MAYQIHLPVNLQDAPSKSNGNGALAALYAERDRLLARWHKGLEFLENLRERKGQECPEFEKYFALWSEIDADLRRVLDRIEVEEMNTRALAIWERIKTKGGL